MGTHFCKVFAMYVTARLCGVQLHTLWSTASHSVEYSFTFCEVQLHTLWSTAPHSVEYGSTLCGVRLHTLWSTAPHSVEYSSTLCGVQLHTLWSIAPHLTLLCIVYDMDSLDCLTACFKVLRPVSNCIYIE